MSPHFPNQGYAQSSFQITSQPISQHITHPAYDINGQPIRIRKKPGRKPNPASPALRKAQNRAAQRAFRERKEKHLHDLEGTIRTLREQRNAAQRELKELKKTVESSKVKTWYLKGVVLTLQFMCMHHNIRIPTHSPYLSKTALEEIAQTTPHTIEAYINAYTRNNENLKSTSYYSCIEETLYQKSSEPVEKPPSPSDSTRSLEHLDSEPMDSKPIHSEKQTHHKNKTKELSKKQYSTPANSICTIENIRQKLGISISFKMTNESNARLRPTIIQLAIPHDPRIDLIPTPHTRDRMIIFEDQMDYERCFSMLLSGSFYKGGDPTESGSWNFPSGFFDEFWYLAINYETNNPNHWKQVKQDDSAENQNKVPLWPNQMENPVPNGWDREIYYEMIENMPALQPFDHVGYPLPPSRSLDLGTISNVSTPEDIKPLCQNMMCSPESRKIMNTHNLGSFHNSP
ncbi:hypothetical protein K501DRAFT_183625 [Backusella circina FSU 941]|nr:hypothetical protein K501DRAFT_183625 [Backusella circina FSU 941]